MQAVSLPDAGEGGGGGKGEEDEAGGGEDGGSHGGEAIVWCSCTGDSAVCVRSSTSARRRHTSQTMGRIAQRGRRTRSTKVSCWLCQYGLNRTKDRRGVG